MLKMQSVSDAPALRLRTETPFTSRQSSGGGSDAVWVYVAGELDLTTAPQLEQTLREAQPEARLVVLDLRELTFVDSAGVHVIADAGIRSRRVGCRLIVVRAPAQVDAVFTLVAVTGDVEVVDLDPGQPVVQALLQVSPDPSPVA